MPKAQKVSAVENLKVELRESEAALLTSFRGLKVAEMTELRRSLAASQTEFKVVKNTLAKIAAKDIGLDELLPAQHANGRIRLRRVGPLRCADWNDAWAGEQCCAAQAGFKHTTPVEIAHRSLPDFLYLYWFGLASLHAFTGRLIKQVNQ